MLGRIVSFGNQASIRMDVLVHSSGRVDESGAFLVVKALTPDGMPRGAPAGLDVLVDRLAWAPRRVMLLRNL